MNTNDVLYEKGDGVGIITLNRPERLNAIDLYIRNGLIACLDEAATDPEVKVVVLTGAGKAFCSGGHAKSITRFFEQSPLETRQTMRGSVTIITKIRELNKPVIAAVNGVATGAGCNLALICDIRIASEKASFGQVFVKVGLLPDWGGTFTLSRLTTVAKSSELIFSGRMISAREAKEIGMVNRVVPESEFNTAWLDMARKIVEMPPELISMAKAFIYQAETQDLQSMLKQTAITEDLLDFSVNANHFAGHNKG